MTDDPWQISVKKKVDMGASSSALPDELTLDQVKELVGSQFDEAKFAELEKNDAGKKQERIFLTKEIIRECRFVTLVPFVPLI